MSELLALVTDPAMGFFRLALATGSLASVAFGIIGSFVVARRITYLAGAIAHSVLGGIGLCLYLQRAHGLAWLDPFWGALAFGVLAAVVIGVVSLRGGQREDTVIGGIWAVGMAAGLLFLARTPGRVEPMNYLFGNILLLGPRDVWLVAGLDALIVLVTAGLYNRFVAVCFDEEFARLRGVAPERYYIGLLVLTALAIVLLVRIVGIVMVVALLTLPAGVAGFFSRSLARMMAGAIGCCLLFVNGGLLLALAWDLPAGPTIILVAGAAYLATTAGRKAISYHHLDPQRLAMYARMHTKGDRS